MDLRQSMKTLMSSCQRHTDLGLTMEEATQLIPNAREQANNEFLLPGQQQQQKNRSTINRMLNRIALLIFFASYTILLWSYTRQAKFIHETNNKSSSQLLGNEVIYNDVPRSLQTFPFSRAGFHKNDSTLDPKTKFEGRPNAENNVAWHHILNVGVIAISEEENSRLPNGGSGSVRGRPSEHVVLLAVFHQLHCLKYLRDLIYDITDAGKISSETDGYRVMHGDHCIDYLRQTLMCHGDVTPIIQDWVPSLHAYAARQDTLHQCRNFDAIWQWAAERNTTGLRADGRHELHHVMEDDQRYEMMSEGRGEMDIAKVCR